MPASSARVRLLLAAAITVVLTFDVLTAGAPGDDAQPAQPAKRPPTTVAEIQQQLKDGIFKLTESDVLELAGPPGVYMRPGDAGSDLRLEWTYATYIFASFKEGKLSELTGSFSERLPVDRVTLANFKRLRIGMTEDQAVALLGEGNGTSRIGAAGTRSWGRTVRLWVSINAKGLAFNPGSEVRNAVHLAPGVTLPPGVPLLIPEPEKK